MIKKSYKKQIFNIVFVLFLAGLTLLMLWLSSDELNMDAVWSYFENCNVWLLVAAFGCMLLYVILEAFSIHIILRRFKRRPHFLSSLAYASSDVYYSGITPSATGGQPASAFYMIRDGIPGGTACFALVFNLLSYTAALLIIGVVVLILQFPMFLSFSVWVKLFIIVGFSMQGMALTLFIFCIFRPGTVLRIGNFFITVLCRIRIIRKEQKWRDRLTGMVDKYRGCFECFKHQRGLFWEILIYNIIQRSALIMVSALVCLAATDCSVWEMFAMQTFAMMGYNSIPLPGGSGAYEFLYINIYEKASFSQEFILVAMMMTRIISYYLSMLISGLYTAAYHVLAPIRAKKKKARVAPQSDEDLPDEEADEETDEEADEETDEDIPLETPTSDTELTSNEKEG